MQRDAFYVKRKEVRIDILTLFPGYFESPLKESMIKRALDKQLVSIKVHGLREFAEDKHHRVDDRPFGGGAGMVLKPEPLVKGIRQLKKEETHVILLSARGKLIHAKRCRALAKKRHLLFVTGHYEGVDERVLKEVDEEISIGDFILTNGAPAAMLLLDSIVRLIPGVLGNELGSVHESFEQGLLEHAQYTRPACFEGEEVPAVLRNGDAAKIKAWQLEDAIEKTRKNREDLLLSYQDCEGDFLLILEVQKLALSIKFYKAIGFVLEKQEETKAFLRLESMGIVLVLGRGVRERTSMYRLSLDTALFLRAKAHLVKTEGLLLGSDDQRCFFRDLDGHQWVIFRCEQERKNGKESFSGES